MAYILVFLMVVLSGCSSMVKKPEVRFDRVKFSDLSESKLHLHFLLNIKNPNGFDLNINRVQYKMAVNGTPIADGAMEEKIIIPAQADSKVSLPVAFSRQELLTAAGQWLKGEEVIYKLEGSLVLDRWIKIPFAKTDKLPKPKFKVFF